LAPSEANARLINSKSGMGWAPHWKKILGRKSLPMADGDSHKKIRRMSGRAFTSEQLDGYLPQLQELTKQHLSQWAAATESQGKPMDMFFHIKEYTFDVAQTVLLGLRLPTSRFVKLFETLISGMDCIFPFEFPGFFWKKVMSCRRQLEGEYQSVIDQRREQLNAGAKPVSMLDSRLNGDPEPSAEELRDFAIGMMFAGTDTATTTMENILYWLKNAHGASAMEAELRDEARSAWDGSSAITRKTLESIPKIRAFVQEVMRITPTVHLAMRTLAEETRVDGYVVPAGYKLVMAATAVSNTATNPKEFDLRRHLDESGQFEDKIMDYQSAVYATFGGGARMCLGYKLARDEMLVFLLQVLTGYDYEVAENPQKVNFVWNYFRVFAAFKKI
jgi:cytochrome P450 family 90 subfamily A polypeptide 1